MERTINCEMLEKTIDNIVDYTLRMDLTWDWPCGVAYYGVARAWEVTGKQTYIEKLVAWTDEYVTLGIPDCTVNTCAMGHMLLTLYKATNEQKYLDLIMDKIKYLQNDALRFGDRVLQHTVSSNNDFPEQCWADTLFMAAYFMMRTGILLEDKILINDALHQYYWHINYLQNEKSGLWYHGYNNQNKDHMSGFYWGRANAWAAYTMAQARKILPQGYLYPAYMDIGGSLREQLASIKLLQAEDGLWRTILDDSESYGEVSATAGIAAAMLIAENPMHTKYINKATDVVLLNITETGRVQNVSGGTAVMNDRAGYLGIPKRWAQGWGQGLVLAFLSALLEKEKASTKLH